MEVCKTVYLQWGAAEAAECFRKQQALIVGCGIFGRFLGAGQGFRQVGDLLCVAVCPGQPVHPSAGLDADCFPGAGAFIDVLVRVQCHGEVVGPGVEQGHDHPQLSSEKSCPSSMKTAS